MRQTCIFTSQSCLSCFLLILIRQTHLHLPALLILLSPNSNLLTKCVFSSYPTGMERAVLRIPEDMQDRRPEQRGWID